MIIGVTGTRSGMTHKQKKKFISLLTQFKNEWKNKNTPIGLQFHHGDCLGVDVETARLAKLAGYYVVNHPPEKDDLRAYHESDEIREPLSYFARNRNIVNVCTRLLVIPYQSKWSPKGGTWYTHDYAVKQKKPLIIIWPDGTVEIK